MHVQDFKTKILAVKDKLYRLAYLLLQDKEDAEDILQEVCLKLWTGNDKINSYRSFEAFSMCMTKNLCLDHLKKIKRRGGE